MTRSPKPSPEEGDLVEVPSIDPNLVQDDFDTVEESVCVWVSPSSHSNDLTDMRDAIL